MLKPILFKDLPALETMLDKIPDPKGLGWTCDEYSQDWTPPNDKIKDPEYFGLMDIVDWSAAAKCGFPKDDFEGTGHNRESRIFRLKRYVVPNWKQKYLQTRAKEDQVKKLLSPADIGKLQPPKYLVDGVIPENSLVLVTGAPASGKSFFALDVMAHLCQGQDWHGRSVKPQMAIWGMGEGTSGVRPRLTAWAKHHGFNIDGLEGPVVWEHPIIVTEGKELENLLNEIESHFCPKPNQKDRPHPLGLVVIDTLARSFVHGDENAAHEMGRFIAGCDELKRRTGATVVIVHHEGKDSSKGARGSSALVGAVDVHISIKKANGFMTIKCSKAKEMPEFAPIRFKLTEVDVSKELSMPSSSAVLVEDKTAKTITTSSGRTTLGKPSKVQSHVYDYVCENPSVRHGQIVDHVRSLGHSTSGVEKAIKALKDEGNLLVQNGLYSLKLAP